MLRTCSSVFLMVLLLAVGNVFAQKKNIFPDAGNLNLSQKTFVYQNPVSIGIYERGLRDCQIFRDGEWWYMTGTGYAQGLGSEQTRLADMGVPLYKSKNLAEWQFVKNIVNRPAADKWYYERFWAPEVHRIGGKYYATFNCRNEQLGYSWQHFGYAVSDHIEGPYKVVTEDKPLARGNDVTLFEDDDKRVYTFWHNVLDDGTFWLGGAEIDLNKGEFIGKPFEAIKTGRVEYEKDAAGNIKTVFRYGRNERKIKTYYEWDSQGIEGAYVIKKNNIYYLFYSSWTRGYEIGYATATNIKGPWKKAKQNPIYGGVDEKLSGKRGFTFKQNPLNPFTAVGHNAIFNGPDGRLWLSCHGISKYYKAPFLVIDPLDFEADGSIKKKTPTFTPQLVKW